MQDRWTTYPLVVDTMSEQWIDQCEMLLKMLDVHTSKKERDRLEIINSILFSLATLGRSIQGWKQWTLNLQFMSRFTEAELLDIEEGLVKTVRTFIEYDIDVTKRHVDKLPQRGEKPTSRETGVKVANGLYA